MGSDGFEFKKLGGAAPSGTGPVRLGPNEFSGADRDAAVDAFAGLGDAAANLVEISGVIKWFDASKGYGFIVPDNGWPDVLLHVTVLRRDGYQTAYEGARLVVSPSASPRRMMSAFVSVDERRVDPEPRALDAGARRQRASGSNAAMNSGRQSG